MVALMKFLFGVFSGLFYRVELRGRENIPEKGAAILCANHLSETDMFFIGYRIKRLVRWMAKEELFRIPLVGFVIKKVGAFPIKRGTADVDSIKTALKLLEEGHIVGIFPEGSRTRGKAEKKAKVKRGAVTLAMKAEVPIIPVAIDSSYKPFSKVKVIFGEPFELEPYTEKKYTNEEMLEKTRNIMARVYHLLEEDAHGNYRC